MCASSSVVPALADEPVEAIRIVYDAPAGCPDAAAFMSQIRARTPRFRAPTIDEQSRVLTVKIERGAATSEGHLRMRALDGQETARDVQGATCEEVTSALALIAAVAIDPEANAEAQAPSNAPAPVILVPSFPLAGPPSPPPPPAPPRIVRRPRAEVSRWRLAAGAELALAFATAPSTLVGFRGFLDVRRVGPTSWQPSARLSFVTTNGAEVATSLGTARISWTSGRADACLFRVPARSAFGVEPCAFFELGALRGSGSNTEDPANQTPVWAAPGALLRASGVLFERLILEAEGGAGAPLVRDRFFFGPDATAFRVQSVTGSFAVGVGVRFL